MASPLQLETPEEKRFRINQEKLQKQMGNIGFESIESPTPVETIEPPEQTISPLQSFKNFAKTIPSYEQDTSAPVSIDVPKIDTAFTFEEINNIHDFYSYDSLKVRINGIISGSPSAFKRNMAHFDVDYNAFESSFKYIKDNIVADSTYSLDSINDSLFVIINNSIFGLEGIEAISIDEKIDKLEVYLSMYNDLDLPDTANKNKDQIENRRQEPFKDLDLENLEIDKLKLNLTK